MTKALIVNDEHYRETLSEFFVPKIDEIIGDDIFFKQDDATCHTAAATIDLLCEKCGTSIILRDGPHKWPPRSDDLTPLDIFLGVL